MVTERLYDYFCLFELKPEFRIMGCICFVQVCVCFSPEPGVFSVPILAGDMMCMLFEHTHPTGDARPECVCSPGKTYQDNGLFPGAVFENRFSCGTCVCACTWALLIQGSGQYTPVHCVTLRTQKLRG